MKKKILFLGILVTSVLFLATGCMFYNLMKSEDFKNHYTALGYTISENETGKYESKNYLVASKDDVPFKIEYYEFEKEVDAKKVYEKYKKDIVSYITSDSKNHETSGAVFSKTVATSEKEYLVISRVKNTLIFIAGTIDYKTEIDKLVEDVKY